MKGYLRDIGRVVERVRYGNHDMAKVRQMRGSHHTQK